MDKKACALCSGNGDLRNSHIIAELFFRLVYDENPRRLRVVSGDPSEAEYFEQKGLREYLLCEACEQKLGTWENYVKKVFVERHGIVETPIAGGVRLQGIDYKKFKLFLLSLLWRMSVSSLEFFKLVDLGPEEEDKLRVAIINEDPLQPEDYPCFLTVVKLDGWLVQDWIFQPSQIRGAGLRAYWLVINGIMYTFFIGGKIPQSFAGFPINKQNELAVGEGNAMDFPYLEEPLMRLYLAIQARKKGQVG